MSKERKKEIRLEGNRHVNREMLEKVARIRKELEEYGHRSDRGYRIAPALGGEISEGFLHPDREKKRGTSAWNVIPETNR